MMRVEVFLQSAAIKILRQKLSQVSFSAGTYDLESDIFVFSFSVSEIRNYSLFDTRVQKI